jgi:predicted nucleic acid-binding protein
MNCVVDASWSAALFLPDERSDQIADQVAGMAGGVLYVPELWWYETTNIILSAERRGRLTPVQVERIYSLLVELPLHTDERIGLLTARRIHDIASATTLSAYDAAYIELAVRLECAIATLDQTMARAAEGLGLSVQR